MDSCFYSFLQPGTPYDKISLKADNLRGLQNSSFNTCPSNLQLSSAYRASQHHRINRLLTAGVQRPDLVRRKVSKRFSRDFSVTIGQSQTPKIGQESRTCIKTQIWIRITLGFVGQTQGCASGRVQMLPWQNLISCSLCTSLEIGGCLSRAA